MNDLLLISRAARGERSAFELLYERHWTPVYSYAWLLTRSVADAEDLAQECFLALIRRPLAFDGNRVQLRTWLIAVVRKQYLWRLRRAGRDAGSDDLTEVAVPAGLDEDLIRGERADAVRLALTSLPEAQREALYLFEFEGLSLAEVAEVLDIEPNAVKARLFRGREQLKRLLTPLQRRECL